MNVLRGAVSVLVLVFAVTVPAYAGEVTCKNPCIAPVLDAPKDLTCTTTITLLDQLGGDRTVCEQPPICYTEGPPVCRELPSPCEQPPGVPEPATLTLLLAGLAAFGTRVRRSVAL